jgi:signal transduction histidine kinase/ligand-binding sensor domain-containing protein
LLLLLTVFSALPAVLAGAGGDPAESSEAHTQHAYQIDTWTTEDGLPENSATSMVQTPDGYLWFGTFNGLVRFDGVRFTAFNPGNTPELPSPGIVDLHLDRRGRLWVCTLRGIVVREGDRWRLIHRADPKNEEYVLTVAERRGGDLLFTLYNGQVLQFADDQLTELPTPPGAQRAGYKGWADEQGDWWVLQRQFLGSWTGKEWVPRLPEAGIPASQPICIGGGPARNGGWWLLRDRELRRYSGGIEVDRRALHGPETEVVGTFSSLTEDSDGNVWVCTYESGLLQFPPRGQARRWTEKDGLAYQDVRFVFEDRERNIWVGTSGGGLMRFKPRRFQVFGHESPGDAPRVVNSVALAPGGGLWLATFGQGFFRLGPEGKTHRYRLPGWQHDSRFFETTLVDRQDRTWVSILNNGLHVFDAQGGKHIPMVQSGGHLIRALFEDSTGRVWTSGGSGIAVFEGETPTLYGPAQGVPDGTVVCFEQAADGAIWFSNLEGVFRFERNRAVELRSPEGGALAGVTALKSAGEGTLWMGTLDRGLLRWRNGSLANVGSSEGLPVRSIHGILEDDEGYFWMASNRGVVRARRIHLDLVAEGRAMRLPCQVLDRSEGLPSVECPNQRQPIAARDPEGRLWFATMKGVAMIEPASFRINSLAPPVLFEEITYHHLASSRGHSTEAHRWVLGTDSKSVSLPAGSRWFEVRFTAPSFVAPEKVRFEIRLEGRDNDWQDIGDRRTAYYHELAPGNYTLRVRAANNDGVWNETGTSLAFSVQPYLWQTVWFRFGVAGLLLGLGTLAARTLQWVRHRREVEDLKREQRHQAELAHFGRVAAMGQLASSIAHELNQPLGAILRNAEAAEWILKDDSPDLDEIRAILADIRSDDQRAGEVINGMRALFKRREFQSTRLDPEKLVGDVALLVQSEARAKHVQLSVDLPSPVPAIQGDRVQLQQVVLNLLLNAIDAVAQQPVADRRVRVGGEVRGDQLELSIADTGPGIAEAAMSQIFEPFYTTKAEGLGMGLAIVRSIIQAHGGAITAANRPQGGVVFRFALPLAHDESHS